jgi:succinate dehydrogenase/fumarate reductase-like Fe-S protein
MRITIPTLILLLSLICLRAPAENKTQTVDQLKAEAARADAGQQAKLYAEIAERLVAVADKQFTDAESVKGHATIQELAEYAGKAHDTAIKSRKKMKETEIHLRRCKRALENMRRTLAAEDRPTVEAVEKKLEQLAENLLEAMFAPRKEQK